MNRFRYWLYERLMKLAFLVYPAQKEQELDQESLEWLNLYTNPPENGCECDICRDLKAKEERLSFGNVSETVTGLTGEELKPTSIGTIAVDNQSNLFVAPRLEQGTPKANKAKATTTKKKVAKKTPKKSPLRPVRIK